MQLTLEQRQLLTFEVQEFLFHEARLLDAREYRAWLELLADDIHYWMPIRRTTTAREVAQEFTRIGDIAFFDEDKTRLNLRVERLYVGRAWAEDPPSRTRRLITNVSVMEVVDDVISVTANFHLYRTRLNSEEDSWIGRREDKLRRTQGGFELVQRHIYLEQTVILAQNMSIFF